MVIPISSHNRRFLVRIGVRAFAPIDLGILAHDTTRPNTHYFRRKVPFLISDFHNGEAYREIIMKMPLSPKVLAVKLYDKHGKSDSLFKLEKFEVDQLEEKDLWAEPHMHDFIAFAKDFVERAGYLETGFYHCSDYQFLIHYLPQIKSEFGQVLITPARTHRVTGRHQVSQEMFRQFTVPVRMFIMLHERQHFTIPTREEIPADLAALKLYLDMGFPTIEAVYAATQVFRMHPNTIGPLQTQRTRQIIGFINDYKKENALNR